MRQFFLIILAVLIFFSCKTKDKQAEKIEEVPEEEPMQWKENDSLRLATRPMGLSAWLDYYQRSDPRFRLSAFKASGVVLHFGGMPDATRKGKLEEVSPYFVYSPDSSRYIDLFSYDHFMDKGVLTDGEADQEVVLADQVKGLRKQLLFNGPYQSVDFADWLGKERFLLGITSVSEDGKTLAAQLLLFNIADSTYTNFNLDHSLRMDSIRFGAESFEEIYLNKFKLK